ncbi:hypothetical protein GCM10012289_27590 [Nonomuraea cavernae]|uniref:Uncharacterized protein n=1 Tax=Nonomuraea cavernae TaxID=2045107 RepID=A0A918DIU5_9ACTN|nr:hypothetical protein GCM10012289_27590 [Nonomuraea cavernae]
MAEGQRLVDERPAHELGPAQHQQPHALTLAYRPSAAPWAHALSGIAQSVNNVTAHGLRLSGSDLPSCTVERRAGQAQALYPMASR